MISDLRALGRRALLPRNDTASTRLLFQRDLLPKKKKNCQFGFEFAINIFDDRGILRSLSLSQCGFVHHPSQLKCTHTTWTSVWARKPPESCSYRTLAAGADACPDRLTPFEEKLGTPLSRVRRRRKACYSDKLFHVLSCYALRANPRSRCSWTHGTIMEPVSGVFGRREKKNDD